MRLSLLHALKSSTVLQELHLSGEARVGFGKPRSTTIFAIDGLLEGIKCSPSLTCLSLKHFKLDETACLAFSEMVIGNRLRSLSLLLCDIEVSGSV